MAPNFGVYKGVLVIQREGVYRDLKTEIENQRS